MVACFHLHWRSQFSLSDGHTPKPSTLSLSSSKKEWGDSQLTSLSACKRYTLGFLKVLPSHSLIQERNVFYQLSRRETSMVRVRIFSREACGLWSFTQLAEGTYLLQCGVLTGV